jgi:hypothetical protein
MDMGKSHSMKGQLCQVYNEIMIMNVVKDMDHKCILNELLGLLKQNLLPQPNTLLPLNMRQQPH